MPEKIVFQPAWVRCTGPQRHHFTTAEDVKQLAHYVANRNARRFHYPTWVVGQGEVP